MLVVMAAANGDAVGSVLDLVVWLLFFIVFLILGAIILKRLRTNAKAGPVDEESGGIAPYERLLREGLITRDEFESIRRNLRDQMVYEIYQEEKVQKPKEKAKKQRRGTDDRESRLEALLRSERR